MNAVIEDHQADDAPDERAMVALFGSGGGHPEGRERESVIVIVDGGFDAAMLAGVARGDLAGMIAALRDHGVEAVLVEAPFHPGPDGMTAHDGHPRIDDTQHLRMGSLAGLALLASGLAARSGDRMDPMRILERRPEPMVVIEPMEECFGPIGRIAREYGPQRTKREWRDSLKAGGGKGRGGRH